jgi:hypothetical protein
MTWRSGQVFTDFRTRKKTASSLTLSVRSTIIWHCCKRYEEIEIQKAVEKAPDSGCPGLL